MIIALLCSTASAATTIYVGPGEANAMIQGAVNNATSGDIIIVRDGAYNENVNVGVTHLTIQSENGSANCFVNAPDPDNHIFNVSMFGDYANISGFTIRDATGDGAAGIYLGLGVDYCNIADNIVSNSDVGISIYHSNNNTITDNTVNSNDCGIRMEMSCDNTLQNNIVNSNEGDGIYLSMFSDDNVFTNNTANLNDCGIHLHQSNDNAFTDNTANSNDGNGTYLSLWSSNNTFTNNTANSNDCGIHLRQSNNNTFVKNTVSSNDYGIRLYQSNNNSITCNGVCNNAQRGLRLFLFSRDNNISYNNIIANGAQQANGSYQWQFDNAQINSVVAENNYWGTADGLIIAASTMGDVDCEPFETVACTCAPTPEPPTSRPPIYVGPGEANTTIQGAVNNATSGDTIIVRDGTYNENVDVDVAHLTIRSENGSANCFVNASYPNDSVFRMIVNYVDISGFTVENATGNNAAGIYLGLNANHCNISGNTVSNNNVGIYLYISPDNTLQNNIVNLNKKEGIYMGQADRNILRNNIVNSNTGIGISIDHSDDIILRNNIANSNNYGIYMGYTVRSVLRNNTANSNNESGINMDHSNNNTLRKNTVNSNDCGVYMAYASNNNITCNGMYNNTGAGVYLESGNIVNNISYNNIIANGDCNATTGGWEWQFVNDQSSDVEAGHNYWGAGMINTTIDASIYDDEEGISGEVKFYPFETEPVTCAPTPEETSAFTTTDAAIALQIAVGNREYGSRWDVNSDGRVTSLDALMILHAATGNGIL